MICGNTVLYGATGGRLFAAGRAGERFAVRNSGAEAVVEGVGAHGCEYMTNGRVVVLGSVGPNFGAGMSGGEAFVLDVEDHFLDRYNPQMVDPARVTLGSPEDAVLRGLVESHAEATDSPLARGILERWEHVLPLFWRVIPNTTPAAKRDSQAMIHVPQWTPRAPIVAGEGMAASRASTALALRWLKEHGQQPGRAMQTASFSTSALQGTCDDDVDQPDLSTRDVQGGTPERQ